MSFAMITVNQSINGIAFSGISCKAIQNYAIWIQTTLQYTFRLKMFMKTLQIIKKSNNHINLIHLMNLINLTIIKTHQIMKLKNHY